MPENNPLLQRSLLPPFEQIQADHIVPAIKALTESNLAALNDQLQSMGVPTWENLVKVLEARDDVLDQAWSPVSHLNSVCNTEAFRAAYEEALALLTAYGSEMGQNRPLFEAYQTIRDSEGFAALTQPQKQAIDNALRDFKLSGVALEGEARERFRAIKKRLSELSNTFSNNVLDATRGWTQLVESQERVAGLPNLIVAGAKKAAEDKGQEGWLFTLDIPVYMAVMQQADDRELRKAFYFAYNTRASDQGPMAGKWDNSEVINEILQLRQEKAKLLGFGNYSELSIAPKMAESTEQVVKFLDELAARAKPAADQELQELRQWASENLGMDQLEAWDVAYCAEKLKQAKYDISQEELRPYFTLPKVLEGMFSVAGELFDISIEATENTDVWHPDVQFFEIRRQGEKIASFYFDLFAREGKRGGAWMAECRVRRLTEEAVQLPVAYMVCNFSAPLDGGPALLTHNELTTLFHEFGHGLHHMLTQVNVAAVSGINGVAWDAVELPSQFMENWCWLAPVLKRLTGHVDTGEPLPDEMIEKLIRAKNFHSALMMVRQLEFSLFDFKLHMISGEPDFPGVQATLDTIREQVGVITPPAENRFQHGFTHIFAGGYAAGYFSYKWAEVLSADAFAAFEENGLLDGSYGAKFLDDILSRGGSEDAMTLFKRFRGREPKIDALLRHSGIV